MARLRLALLGPFQAFLDEALVTDLASDKVRALLAYLAVESDRAHSRDALAALLWPDAPDAAARANLRNSLSNLRAAIADQAAEPPFLLIDRDSLQFNRASDHELDVASFWRASEGVSLPELEEALALYRGDLLEGLGVRDSPAFEDWLILARERLRERLLRALGRAAALHEQAGDLELATERARRWAELAPLDEEAQRALMRLLARNGQRAAALAQYEACRQALRDELGVEPEEATAALAERIRRGELLAPRRPQNLPISLFPFVGRADELARLAACLRDPGCRLLTVVGPGGVGKTRLAAEAAQALSDAFEEGVCFAPLASVAAAEGLAPAIGQALGLAFYPGAGVPPKEQLLGYLRERQLLLVLDSCEHLPESAALAAEILAAAPGVKVLATSRARLNVAGEQLLPLAGLPCEPVASTECPAGELFQAAAQRARPGYAVSAADAPAVAAICQRVEGLPLAILLAASWMPVLEPGEIAAQLEPDSGRGIDFLAADWQGVPERERSMRATLDGSWELLSERERGILAGLAVFRGGFTAAAAEAVTGATLRDLARLVDHSLVLRRASGRYDLHDLLREYAAVKLAAAPDGGAGARERHADHYRRATAGWETEITRLGREKQALAEMEAEWANVCQAWGWAVEGARWRWLNAFDRAVSGYAWYGSQYQAVQPLFAAAEARLREALRDPATERVAALLALGRIRSGQGFLGLVPGHQAQVEALRESLALLEQAERAGEPVSLWERSNTLRRLGARLFNDEEAEESARCCAQAAELARATGDGYLLGGALHVGGRALITLGRFEEAERWLRETLALRLPLGSVTALLENYQSLVWVAAQQGRFGEADRWIEEAIALAQRDSLETLSPMARRDLAGAAYLQGRFELAERLWGDQAAFFRERGLRGVLAGVLLSLGLAGLMTGRYADARTRFEEALRLVQESGNGDLLPSCWCNLGLLALGEGDGAQAGRWLERLRGEPDPQHLACFLRAPVAIAAGQWEEARRAVSEALAHRSPMEALPLAALYLAAQGQAERAVELYALARTSPCVARSRWHEEVFGQRIAQAAANLPPEAIRAAQERGRARDWLVTVEELRAERAE
ncbi:MAG: AAA family ATPase, partial [Chloroflexi bacterium]|nr:AAA family ATPase [Chloroflexota bacterium]